jgi:dTDP-4-amino-4,6-dideoxygalactose transaminase
MSSIPFNKPYLHGRELVYIAQAVASGKISGDGMFTLKCHDFFERRYGFPKVLMTTSCTDALEMAALLLDIKPGDEVIVPSYTFVSSANAFVLRGANIVFADSEPDRPHIDPLHLESLITSRTRAIVVVHYAGVACDMDPILDLARKHDIKVVEDAAQAVDSFYKGRPLGGLGVLGTFSFHETKNVIAGEGGLLAINDPSYITRAEIIREKGTNRSAFFRGEVDKYGWVDLGSSFLPSDIISAYLYAQLEVLDDIQAKRKLLWARYHSNLSGRVEQFGMALPHIPEYASNNAHIYYLLARNLRHRTELLARLKRAGVGAIFHYLSLHTSPYFKAHHDGRALPNSDRYSETLIRLPLHMQLTPAECDRVCDVLLEACQDCG